MSEPTVRRLLRRGLSRLFGARGNVSQPLSSLAAYELWAANYPPTAHNTLMEIEQAAMLDLMPSLENRVVLDLASGTGRYGEIARKQGAKQVIALDNSAAMLAANSLPGRAQATFEALPLAAQSVDVIVCGLALGHLPMLGTAFAEIGRVLKPGGAALISDFHPFAYLSGARRTFSAPDGRVYAVEHHPHLDGDYRAAAEDAGLRIDVVREPLYNDAPVVLVLLLSYDRERQTRK